MKDTSKIEQQEAFLKTIAKLIHVNYKILEVVDVRLTQLEDQVDLLEKKKEN